MRRTESFDVLSVKIHAVDDWKNQKSSKHAYRVANMEGVYFAYMGRTNPLTD